MATTAAPVVTLDGEYLHRAGSDAGRRATLTLTDRFVIVRSGDAELAWDRTTFTTARIELRDDGDVITLTASEGSVRFVADPGQGTSGVVHDWADPDGGAEPAGNVSAGVERGRPPASSANGRVGTRAAQWTERSREGWSQLTGALRNRTGGASASDGRTDLHRSVVRIVLVVAGVVGALAFLMVLVNTFESSDVGTISGVERVVRFVAGTALVTSFLGSVSALALLTRLGTVAPGAQAGTAGWTGLPFADPAIAVRWARRLSRLLAGLALGTVVLGTVIAFYAGAALDDGPIGSGDGGSFGWGAFWTMWLSTLALGLVDLALAAALDSSAGGADAVMAQQSSQ